MPVAVLPLVIGGLGVVLLMLVSVAGNLLVCIAIQRNSRLRRIENLFLASLAVSDMLVAILVMPVAGTNDLLGYWMFGPGLCDAWIAVDIMCSTASILNLCAISLDRYIHIKDPFQYSGIVTKRAAYGSIAAVWILSAVVSILPISLGLHRSLALQRSHSAHPATCALDLSPLYAVLSSAVSFFLPCLVMVFIYCHLYLYSRRLLQSIPDMYPSQPYWKEHKAAITIGVVMGIFLVCWLPFFCANVLVTFCTNCVSSRTFTVFTWLGYSNSMFNPVVYTVLNSEFRQTFKLILMRRLELTRPLSFNSSGS